MFDMTGAASARFWRREWITVQRLEMSDSGKDGSKMEDHSKMTDQK
jgi:hypothetical protein